MDYIDIGIYVYVQWEKKKEEKEEAMGFEDHKELFVSWSICKCK